MSEIEEEVQRENGSVSVHSYDIEHILCYEDLSISTVVADTPCCLMTVFTGVLFKQVPNTSVTFLIVLL